MTDILVRDGHVRDMFIEFVVRGGAVRSCLVSAELIRLGGRPCLLGVTRDITDRVIADERLRQTTEQLRQEHQELLRKNIALNEILGHIDEDKEQYRHEICANIDNLLRPTVRKLQQAAVVALHPTSGPGPGRGHRQAHRRIPEQCVEAHTP
jgi:hypothetical protein